MPTSSLPLLPIGIQSFEQLRSEPYVYVDKTEGIHRMVTQGKAYFLSRPRRFGKSLLVTTLEALFQGRRELFEGLWMAEQSEWTWEKHPVIRLDLSKVGTKSPEELTTDLTLQLHTIAAGYKVELPTSASLAGKLGWLISQLASQGPVVVLVDEYDKPVIDHVGRGEERLQVAQANREVLSGFYGILKGSSEHMRFLLLTGVSRFSKMSVFSALNHLNDVSLDQEYATLLGYTQGELESAFTGHVQALAQARGQSVQTTLKEIQRWYNGYRFSEAEERVYNPFSTLLLLQKREFRAHWFETGTPTFLVELVKRSEGLQPEQWEGREVTVGAFGSYEIESVNRSLLPLLVQTGYLTIESVQEQGVEKLYTLNYPNEEVRRAMTETLLVHYAEVNQGEDAAPLKALAAALRGGDLESFFDVLRGFFARVPYDIQIPQESYYQTVFFLIHRMLGFQVHVEVKTHAGRIDSVIEVGDKAYVFEFKLLARPRKRKSEEQDEEPAVDEQAQKVAESALTQIRAKRYADRYLGSSKPVTLVGVAFRMPHPEDRALRKPYEPPPRQIAAWVSAPR